LVGVPVILDSPMVGQNLMNHVSYSVRFIVNNASAFQDLNTDIVRQYLNNRTGPMSSTGLSQVKYFQKKIFSYIIPVLTSM
jgi:choline dehydrogenase